LVSADISSEEQVLSGQEPEVEGDALGSLVVAGDGDVHEVEWGVSITKGNGGDVHV